MRTLTEAEVLEVSGAGILEDIGNFIENTLVSIGDAFGGFGTFAGDFFGFDGQFGYNGSSGSDFSFGGFAESLGDAAGTLWALPNTILGAAIGLIGYGIDHVFGDGSATISFDGTFRFGDNPFASEGAAITFGDAQIYGSGAEGNIPHENAHSEQYEIFGPTFLLAYALGGVYAAVNGSNPFLEVNPLESGPYSNPPSPF